MRKARLTEWKRGEGDDRHSSGEDRGETLGATSDSCECVLRAEEERDRERKAAGQRPPL